MAETLDFVRFRDSSLLRDDPHALCSRGSQDGYVYLPGAVSVEKVTALRDRALQSCARQGWLMQSASSGDARAKKGLGLGASDDPRYLAFLADVVPSTEFAELSDDDAIRSVVSALMGAPAGRRHADVCRVFSPDSQLFTTRPHQDAHYLKGADPGWTAWIPLVDCPNTLGPLAVLRASHRAGLKRHVTEGIVQYIPGSDLSDDWVSGSLAIGDVVLFHGNTVHRALPNESGVDLRLSADFRYIPA